MTRPPPTATDQRFTLADGRALGWRGYGLAGGRPVFALHGTPGSRAKYAPADAEARRLGLWLICPDRWGYGLTAAPRRPSLSAYANDIAALADHLGIDRFGLVGISGGGPFAAAVAGALGDRVAAVALVAPVGPVAGAGRGDDITPFHRFCFQVLPRIPGGVRLVFTYFRTVLAISPALAIHVASARAAPHDRATVRDPEVLANLAASFRMGLRPGTLGPVIDMRLFSRPWDVPLQRIRAPARVWLGSLDRNVPQGPARRLAGAIPGAELEIIEGHGHFWVTRHHGEVLAWLDAALDAPVAAGIAEDSVVMASDRSHPP